AAGGDDRRLPAAAAAWRAVYVVGVARAAVHRLPGLNAGAARRAVGLGDENCARATEAGDDCGVVVGDVAAHDAQTRGGGEAGRVEDVLDRERHAVQRAEGVLALVVTVGGARLFERGLGSREDDGVQAWVDRVDVIEVRAHDLDGGQLLVANGARQPTRGRADDISHSLLPGARGYS